MNDFASQRRDFAKRIDLALQGFLTQKQLSGPGIAPDILVEAIRHGVLNGGKRLRPILLIQSAAIFSISEKQAQNAAMALSWCIVIP